MIRRASLLALLVLACLPGAASAHALLDRTEPGRDASLGSAPDQVAFFFSEPVEASLGVVRVFDSAGAQIETGEITRPDGASDAVAVAVPTDLPDGAYTATYRVISADSHPISGGFVFNVGDPGSGPARSVSELLAETEAGPVTDVAFWTARWLGYAAIGIGIGFLGFLALVLAPGLRKVRKDESQWQAAEAALAVRTRTVLCAAAATGLVCGLAALVLQGATASGISFWSALEPELIGEVLETRFGSLTAVRCAAWAFVLAVVAAGGLRARRRPPVLIALGLAAATIVATPALAGHASAQEPSWVLLPADIVHIAAMTLWLGGLGALVLAIPSATRLLGDEDKSALLAAALSRFSALALWAVTTLIGGGVIQSIVYIGPLGELIDTAFGRAILIKVSLLSGLIALGWLNRARLVPRLREAARRGSPPGEAGRLIRRTLRIELATVIVVLGVTAALVSYPPPSGARAGPVSGSAELGPAQLDYTVDPAAVGSNEMHLYLFDSETGAQFAGAKEVRVDLSLPASDVGPIEAELRPAGPGHYVAPTAPFGIRGDWEVEVALRLSRFEQVETTFVVPIG